MRVQHLLPAEVAQVKAVDEQPVSKLGKAGQLQWMSMDVSDAKDQRRRTWAKRLNEFIGKRVVTTTRAPHCSSFSAMWNPIFTRLEYTSGHTR